MRTGLLAPIGKNNPSPCPTNFSAPGVSKITLESAKLLVAKDSREGTLALIKPVTISTLGR